MLRITPSTSVKGAKEYFTQSLTRSDYYIDGQEVIGRWGGKGAQRLGLEGDVDAESYFALCDNRHPETGGQLTPRNKDNRRIGFDFTFSAPKSVSVLYELSGDERILDAFRASARETMEEIEREMKTRVRRNGADHDRETGNMIWAEFTHFTARPVDGVPDAHLHAHMYAFNQTFDEKEGRWKAGQFGDQKRDGQYWEAAFDARLAHRLNTLGIATERRGYSFEIAGTPQSLIDKFSRRKNEIEREAEKKGITDAKGKHAIGYYGREHKNNDLGKAELRKEWDARLTDDERSALADAIHGRVAGDRVYAAEEAKEFALEHSFQNASAVSDKKLKAEALKYAVGSLLPEAVADITQHPEVVAEKRDGQLMTTTKTVLRNEVAMLQFAKDGQRKFRPLADAESVKESLTGLSAEQRKAALHVLTSFDQTVGIRGGAGTGKTHMLKTVNAVISSIENRSGDYSTVYAFAQSATASRGELAKVGFKDAQTLAMLFKSEKLQAQLHKQVILVDEAGLVSSKDMKRLFDIAKKQESRVILVGDYRQHSSIEQGDAFRLCESEGGLRYAELKEIRRQTDPRYKKAVEHISSGTSAGAQRGFDVLDKMGCVIEAQGEERHAMLVGDYLKAVDDGKSALIIAPTHAEGEKLTGEVRAALKERGAIGEEKNFIARRSTAWTDAQKGDVRNYAPGMVIDFHEAVAGTRKRIDGTRVTEGGFQKGEAVVVTSANADTVTVMRTDGTEAALPMDKKERFQVSRTREIALGRGDRIRITKNGEAKVEGQAKGTRLVNGDIYTVEGFTKEGDIRLENGKLLPKDWGHITHGVVETSYSSQGKTVDRVFIATGNESLPAANQQQWYVSASRGREMAKLYVDSKDDVRDAIARTGQRLSAVELTKTRLKDSWRRRFSETLERNRVARFLKARANAIADYWRGREGMSYA